MKQQTVARCFAVVFFVFSLSTYASQILWQTTRAGSSSGACQLESNKITLTVNPFSVDVEEEAVIAARGTVGWGDPATLEIVGECTLTKGTALRSMLLWNGQKILKAKLKDRKSADSAYQNIVNRDVPRDPALIEYLGDNTYRFRIYPVSIDGARKIRILYSVPYQVVNSGPQFCITSAFTAGADQTPTQVPIEIRRATQTTGSYILTYGDVKKTVQFGATYQVPFSALATQTYNYNYYYSYSSGWQSKSLTIAPDSQATAMAYAATLDSGKTAGHYAAVFAALPDTVSAAVQELQPLERASVEAKVVVGSDAYITDFNDKPFLCAYLKSAGAWDGVVYWAVYNSKGKQVMQYRQACKPQTDAPTTAALPLMWGAKYSLVEGLGDLGALFGFVDHQMSLLALESDTLSRTEADKWAQSGVPVLNPQEIVVKQANMPSAPGEIVFFDFGTGVTSRVKNTGASLKIVVMANRTVSLRFANCKAGAISAKLYDIGGRLLGSWQNVRVSGATAELQLPPQARGCMILRVFAGGMLMQKKFTVAQ